MEGHNSDKLSNQTICVACNGAVTLCFRHLQVLTEPTITKFLCKEICIDIQQIFDSVPMFNFNVVTNVFHLGNKNVTNTKDVFVYDADVCIFYTLQSNIIKNFRSRW